MTRPELEVIARAAGTVPERGLIVEIGSFAGRSAVNWAANSRPSVEICCINPIDYGCAASRSRRKPIRAAVDDQARDLQLAPGRRMTPPPSPLPVRLRW
jgi:hypothetical protein